MTYNDGTEVTQKLIQLFTEKEKDHHDWLNALEESIVDGVPFTKAKDPHQCAFGKWYDKFQTLAGRFILFHRRCHISNM